MLAKLMNEKMIMAVVGLIVTALNTFLDDLFSDGQLYAFAAIIVGFIMTRVNKEGIQPEQLTESVEIAMNRIDEKKKDSLRQSF